MLKEKICEVMCRRYTREKAVATSCHRDGEPLIGNEILSMAGLYLI